MKKWLSIFLFTFLAVGLLLGVNEYLLKKARHINTIVSDSDLWAIERERLDELNERDIVLIGASRMQVDIDLQVMQRMFPEKKIIQLALSGRGSSLPVLEDILMHSKFKGTIIIDESQASLADSVSQQDEVVQYFHRGYSLDKKLNKLISMKLQEQFLFLNPNSNSERLWGNLLGKKQLPPPMFTMTYSTREQTSFFDLTDTRWIYKLRINGVKKRVRKVPQSSTVWLTKVSQWKPLVDKFAGRGGKVLFLHMPFSQERWELENNWMPKQKYWDKAMELFGVASIHFADYPQLQEFKVPDTSHLDAENKELFTKELSVIIRNLSAGI